MRRFALVAALAFPALAWAVGSEDDTPPTPTQTTTECTDGKVWDAATESCVAPQESSLDDDVLYDAAREFAYAGQFENALGALAAMSDPTEDRVLTYLGFAHRQSGNTGLGMDYYQQAIAKNPDNLLARSYMGQAFVKLGALDQAREQLLEIRARGGERSWPELALERAIESGRGYAY
ncbi:MAG: tetratricopeptide repeat protein [Rhodobacteraceae bacterium]|nr:tetratricopeptide repeat protein [Alphaproteobacteria bacterium]MBT8476272.1 tetratricopeptide repeat protein [Alphaproteobacteria bacterium]NNF71820.1 tetratricopeptide repeat protein [Paracoccaceae bacterium]NNK66294.1 tetratricopeptide repeat protein [Paracoccaceae bacterium]